MGVGVGMISTGGGVCISSVFVSSSVVSFTASTKVALSSLEYWV